MNKEGIINVLGEMRDFEFQKTQVEVILSKGYKVMFIPKFHCEINPIVCVWCHAKHCTRVNCDYITESQMTRNLSHCRSTR